METNLGCTLCRALWDCIFQTGLGEVWGRIERVELLTPKLMFIKGQLFLKRFYEIPYLE